MVIIWTTELYVETEGRDFRMENWLMNEFEDDCMLLRISELL